MQQASLISHSVYFMHVHFNYKDKVVYHKPAYATTLLLSSTNLIMTQCLNYILYNNA